MVERGVDEFLVVLEYVAEQVLADVHHQADLVLPLLLLLLLLQLVVQEAGCDFFIKKGKYLFYLLTMVKIY